MRSALILLSMFLFASLSYAQPKCGTTDWDCQIALNSALIKTDAANRDAYFDMGYALEKKGRNVEAVAMYDKYLTFPNNNRLDVSAAYRNRGLIHVSDKNYQAASQDFSRSLEVDPGNPKTLRARMEAYFQQGKYNNALADINLIVAAAPGEGANYYSRGRIYQELSDFDRALADYDTAIKLDQTLALAFYCRADINHNKKNNPTQAIQDYTKFLSFPNIDRVFVFQAYRERGLAFALSGNLTAAMADTNKAIELQPSNAQAYRNRAFIFRGLKMMPQATADEKKAEELIANKG